MESLTIKPLHNRSILRLKLGGNENRERVHNTESCEAIPAHVCNIKA